MSQESFESLLEVIGPVIANQITRLREPIPAEILPAVTLRCLASGETQKSLAWSYRLVRITVSKVIQKTCQAMWDVFSPIYLKSPDTEEDWKKHCQQF